MATDYSQALHLNKVHPSINQHEFSGKNIETIRLERRYIGARLSKVHNLRSPAHLQLGFCARRTCHTFRRTHSRIHDEIIMVLFPAWHIAKKIGGVPVERKHKKGSLVEAMVQRFRTEPRLTLAIAPEGTRKKVANWHTGFLRIAYEAKVPVALGAIDFPSKHIRVTDIF